MFALGWRSQCFYILVFQHQVNAWMCWGCPSTNGTMEMLRWGLVAVCHHCRWREFSCYRPSPKLRCASKLNAGHWWSVVVLGIWHVLHCFANFRNRTWMAQPKFLAVLRWLAAGGHHRFEASKQQSLFGPTHGGSWWDRGTCATTVGG